jgi:hypothetical protein
MPKNSGDVHAQIRVVADGGRGCRSSNSEKRIVRVIEISDGTTTQLVSVRFEAVFVDSEAFDL